MRIISAANQIKVLVNNFFHLMYIGFDLSLIIELSRVSQLFSKLIFPKSQSRFFVKITELLVS